MAVDGVSLGALAAGSVLVWSAVTGNGVLKSVQEIIKGEKPGSVAETSASGAPSNSAAPSNAVDSANQTLGRTMAALYGWGAGAEWTALNDIVMSESGWSDTIKNPGSDASGIAQNINGFGPGYQEGNAPQQIAWLLSYIKGRYGDPVAAWEFHKANGYY
jgi:hypothetical protein